MANQNPLAYTGTVFASTSRAGVCQFNPQDFNVNSSGIVSLGGTGAVQSINNQNPVAGNFNITGTVSQIQIANSSGSAVLALPATLTAPGSVASTTTLTAGTDLSATNGNISVSGAGKQFRCKGGAATDFIGQATLVAGTVTVANTNISASDRIFLSVSNINASTKLGHLTFTINAGVSFVITSRQANNPATTETDDLSTIDYFIVGSV